MEQRKHTRYQASFQASFSGDGVSGGGEIVDLSTGGCRIRSDTPVLKGDFLGILIFLPGRDTPLAVSLAVVRWYSNREFGVEFIRTQSEDQQTLRQVIQQIQPRASCEDDPELAAK